MTNSHTTSADAESKDRGSSAADRPRKAEGPGARDRVGGQLTPGREKDIVEVAGEGSFPGSDAPSWSGAIAR